MRHTGADQHPEYETMEATSRDGNGDGEEYISQYIFVSREEDFED
jgi:hypothetical protein